MSVKVGLDELHSRSFPTNVVVRVEPAEQAGLAVSLCFETHYKNHFYFTLFVDGGGLADVSGQELLRTFDEERSLFIMDYGDPRLVCTGRITGKILSTTDLERSLAALDLYRGLVSFPEGYEDNLKLAATRGQSPDRYRVDVKVRTD